MSNTTFKPGDKVKRTESSFINMHRGSVYTVKSCDKWNVKFNEVDGVWAPYCFNLVTPASVPVEVTLTFNSIDEARATGAYIAESMHKATSEIGKQILKQIKPPRIDEPTLYGIVEANTKGSSVTRLFLRVWDSSHHTNGYDWRDTSVLTNAITRYHWDELLDPTLVREGI